MPTIALELKKEGKEELLTQVLSDGLEALDPGELFGYAMIALYLGDKEQSFQFADAAKTLANNRKFDILVSLYEIAVDLSTYDLESYKEHFDAIAENPENDNYLSRITSIMGKMIVAFYPKEYGKNYPIYTTFNNSAINNTDSRKSKIRKGILADIDVNYAISLMYHDQSEKANILLQNAYETYPKSDSGQFAALIIAEGLLLKSQFDEAQKILDSLPNDRILDQDIKPAATL
ncbi:hypothetical protein K8I31_05215 [bacterium]|nr:hypothetical protein [bacterium]